MKRSVLHWLQQKTPKKILLSQNGSIVVRVASINRACLRISWNIPLDSFNGTVYQIGDT